MAVPMGQSVAVAKHVLKKRLSGERRFPFVLMLEPLYRCNLACAGCGKIQHPEPTLNTMLSPEECFQAAEECGAPVVSIAGGEPLIHPQIDRIVAGLVERKRFVYLCTNGLLLERTLPKLQPSSRLTISVHLDGTRELHDAMVCREGVFDKAVRAIQAAKEAGFRVNTNTTVYADSSPEQMGALFSFLMELGVDALMVSPGYDYPKAPDQSVFLSRPRMIETFRQIFAHRDQHRWRFEHSPLFLEFLQGKRPLQCAAWGNPTRSVLGWQRPCYLMAEGYAGSFEELMRDTEWERYGFGRDARCTNCMMHSGYEAAAVLATSASLPNMARAARFALAGK
jgi:hopanoid biosynthesis associated radical SAM protein HpnH